MSFRVWLDERDHVLSSLKLYRPLIRHASETTRTGCIGAVFTPRSRRSEGHATELVRAVLDECRGRGDRLCLLFSDIGARYYARLGFRALPADEHWGNLPRRVAARKDLMLRPAEEDDRPAIRSAHDESSQTRSIAVVRDEEHWHFLDVRSTSFFERFNDRQVTQKSWVAVGDGKFVGYIVTVEGRGEWNLREVGAIDGDFDVMTDIVRLAAAQAYREGARRFYAWFPDEVARRLTGWRTRSAPRRRAIPMVLPLRGPVNFEMLESPASAHIPYQDQF
jgi:predicted N-acetyltransferase YhbS